MLLVRLGLYKTDIQGAPKNNNPLEKIDISGIVADFFGKFTAFIEED